MGQFKHELGNIYLTLQAINHRGHQKTYEAGAEVDLDHLPHISAQMLIDKKVVEFVRTKDEKKEKQHGTDS